MICQQPSDGVGRLQGLINNRIASPGVIIKFFHHVEFYPLYPLGRTGRLYCR